MVLPMTTRPPFIPAAHYMARQRLRNRRALGVLAKVSRCGQCGQWTWDGVCTLHPDAAADAY